MTRQLQQLGIAERAACAVLLAFASCGAAAAERVAIETPQVVEACHAAHLPVDDAKVDLLAHMTATSSQPGLQIAAIQPWGGRGAHVRVSCSSQQECLPFYVSVEWSSASAAREAMLSAGVPAHEIDRMEVAAASLATAAAAPVQLQSGSSVGGEHSMIGRPPMLRAGARATLVIDGDRLHIRVPVVCLENGEPGHTIRVAGLDRKQVYLAEIVDGTLLKGTI